MKQARKTIERLRELRGRATSGNWTIYNMADETFDTDDKGGWWWVWVEGIKHYAGVFDMAPDKDGSIAQARITDHDKGTVEFDDANWVATIHNAAPDLMDAVDRSLGVADYWDEVAEALEKAGRENGAVLPMRDAAKAIRKAIEGIES